MKKYKLSIILAALFLCSASLLGQGYLQDGNACFAKGDYECARKNYILAKNMEESKEAASKQQQAEQCIALLKEADKYFYAREYEKAKSEFQKILNLNPLDNNVKQKIAACDKEIIQEPPAISDAITQDSLGKDYYYGRNGKSQDYNMAVYWFKKRFIRQMRS